MVEPSDYIEYHLDLPQIPDNLLFTTVDEIRNNCEVIYDAYMYKTYKAPQELYDWLHPHMGDILKFHLQDTMQVRYQVMTEQLPIHKDYDSRGVYKVLNYHLRLHSLTQLHFQTFDALPFGLLLSHHYCL